LHQTYITSEANLFSLAWAFREIFVAPKHTFAFRADKRHNTKTDKLCNLIQQTYHTHTHTHHRENHKRTKTTEKIINLFRLSLCLVSVTYVEQSVIKREEGPIRALSNKHRRPPMRFSSEADGIVILSIQIDFPSPSI